MNFDVSLVTYFEFCFSLLLTFSVNDHDIFSSYIARWNGYSKFFLFPLTPVPRLSRSSTAPTKPPSSPPSNPSAPPSTASSVSPFSSKTPAFPSTKSKTRESTAFPRPTSSSPSRISPPRVLPSPRFCSLAANLYGTLLRTPAYLWRDSSFAGVIPVYEWASPFYSEAAASYR